MNEQMNMVIITSFAPSSHRNSHIANEVLMRRELTPNSFLHSSTVKSFQLLKLFTFDVNFVILTYEKGSKMIFETRNFRSEDLK